MRILIVEDEAIVARRLQRLLRAILGEEITTIALAPSFDAALERLVDHPVDLLLLDLDLGGRDGFELLDRAVAGSFQTIVVSARHDRALEAFEHGVVDFVAKPYDQPRLAKALDRITTPAPRASRRLKILAVRSAGRIELVPISEILLIEGGDDYSRLHCRDGQTLLHDKTLTVLEGLLPAPFERVHRSYIVDFAAVRKLRAEPGSRYSLCLEDGREIPVGRSKAKELKQRLAKS